MKPKRERWLLEFEKAGPVDRGAPTAILVRSLLKTALRAYGLRCTRNEMSQEQESHPVPVDPALDATKHEPLF